MRSLVTVRKTEWATTPSQSIILLLAVVCLAFIGGIRAAGAANALAYVDTTNAAKPYVALWDAKANGYVPYLVYGVQLRLDQRIGYAYYPQSSNTPSWPASDQVAPPNVPATNTPDYYFYAAAQAGFKTVNIPVPWSYIDVSSYTPGHKPANFTYNTEYIQRILTAAKNYNLNVQLLWYGSDVCGYSVAPAYVSADTTDYPTVSATGSDGKQYFYLNLSSQNLISAEEHASNAVMSAVSSQSFPQAVPILQVDNEPDGPGSAPSTWGNVTSMAPVYFNGGQFGNVVGLVNKLASYTKNNSGWTGVTRVNLGSSYKCLDFVNQSYSSYSTNGTMWGVDIFGIDTYTNVQSQEHNILALLAPTTWSNQLSPAPTLDSLASSTHPLPPLAYHGNVTHQPEGGAQFANYMCNVLSNFADGGGAMLYELITLQSWQQNGVWQPAYNLGVYRRTTLPQIAAVNPQQNPWVQRDGSQQVSYNLTGTDLGPECSFATVQLFNSTIYKASQKIALALPSTCAAYNLAGTAGSSGATETHTLGDYTLKYYNWNNSQAFAMLDSDGDLILLNFSAGNVFQIDTLPAGTVASVGSFDPDTDVWTQSYTKSFSGTNNDQLLCWGGECVRVEIPK